MLFCVVGYLLPIQSAGHRNTDLMCISVMLQRIPKQEAGRLNEQKASLIKAKLLPTQAANEHKGAGRGKYKDKEQILRTNQKIQHTQAGRQTGTQAANTNDLTNE